MWLSLWADHVIVNSSSVENSVRNCELLDRSFTDWRLQGPIKAVNSTSAYNWRRNDYEYLKLCRARLRLQQLINVIFRRLLLGCFCCILRVQFYFITNFRFLLTCFLSSSLTYKRIFPGPEGLSSCFCSADKAKPSAFQVSCCSTMVLFFIFRAHRATLENLSRCLLDLLRSPTYINKKNGFWIEWNRSWILEYPRCKKASFIQSLLCRKVNLLSFTNALSVDESYPHHAGTSGPEIQGSRDGRWSWLKKFSLGCRKCEIISPVITERLRH